MNTHTNQRIEQIRATQLPEDLIAQIQSLSQFELIDLISVAAGLLQPQNNSSRSSAPGGGIDRLSIPFTQ